MKKIFAIAGKSGAGKDYYFQALRSMHPEFNYIRRVTTRPRRENEPEDTYFFVDGQEFFRLFFSTGSDQLIEVGTYRDWFYGTPKGQIIDQTINIGIFDPNGIAQLIDEYGEDNVQIVYIDCSTKHRLIRSLERVSAEEDIKEVIRRYQADEKDFEEFFAEGYKNILMIDNDGYMEDSVSCYVQTLINIRSIVDLAQMWKKSLT